MKLSLGTLCAGFWSVWHQQLQEILTAWKFRLFWVFLNPVWPIYQNTYFLTVILLFMLRPVGTISLKHHKHPCSDRAVATLSRDVRQGCCKHQRYKPVWRSRGLGISGNSPFESCFSSHITKKIAFWNHLNFPVILVILLGLPFQYTVANANSGTCFFN